MLLTIVAALAVAAWLVATWYFADDEPLLAPVSPKRVTFKAIVQRALGDLADLTRPVWMWLWLNAPFAAQVAANGVILMDETLRTTVFGHFWGAVALVGANLLARYGATPAHPPIPAPGGVNPHGGPAAP